MKPKVIVYKKLPEDILNSLKQVCEIKYYPDSEDYSIFLHDLHDAEGIIGAGMRIDQHFLKQAPKLRIVSNVSVGYDNLDIQELTKRNIMATNTPDVLNETTADAIFGLLLITARRMAELDRYVKEGKWEAPIGENLFGVDVHHKTLGIIGMGKIGTAIAKRAHFGFGMNILYHNRSRNQKAEEQFHAIYCELEDLLKQSDFVCLMTPLTSETKHLIGLKQFQLMKRSAIFINGSRGQTVNEKDLIYALQNKLILGAGLDVFEQEPVPKDHPLLKMNNVVTLPHIGSATYETRYAMAKLAAENLIKGLKGLCPPNLINQEVMRK